MTTPCENCIAMREVAGWAIALLPRLLAFVLIVAGLALMWFAKWLDDLVTQSPEHRD